MWTANPFGLLSHLFHLPSIHPYQHPSFDSKHIYNHSHSSILSFLSLSLPPSPLSAWWWWWWCFFLLFSCMACLLPPSQSPQTANPTRLWFCAWKMKMVNFKENVLLLMRTSPLNLSPVILSARSFSLSLTHSLHLSLCVSLCSVCETSATSLSCSAFHIYTCTYMYCTYKKYSGGIEIVADGNTMVFWYILYHVGFVALFFM